MIYGRINFVKKLIVANWKLNPQTIREAVTLAQASDQQNTVICPPFCFLPTVKKYIKRASLGAQDCFWEEGGAYTGKVSPVMLKNLGVEYVIVGHSERRKWLGETDEMINRKIKAAAKIGLKIILCVGESPAVHQRGIRAVKKFIGSQLLKDLTGTRGKLLAKNLVIAYEPIWAISTTYSKKSRDNSDTPQDAAGMINFIKKFLHSTLYILHSKVLYGGSVTSKNAENFLKYKEIDGALVGGASLKLKEIKKIIQFSSRYNA